MTEKLHSYDMALFSRSFLNCAQRHSIVMLAERRVRVAELFATCHVSSDVILDQCIRKRIPKYDFDFDGLTDADFQMAGVDRKSQFPDNFATARDTVLERIAADGFVLLAGDVFYLEHCPEFRNAHLFHLIIVTGYDAQTDTWAIIDDNPASVLCHYSYKTPDLAAFYNNNSVREFRTYAALATQDTAAALHRFRAHQKGRTDSLVLLTGIHDLLASPWNDPGVLFGHLGQAMSILAGSRRCFGAFLRDVAHQPDLANMADALSDRAFKLRELITFAGLGKMPPSRRIPARAAELAAAEADFSASLITLTQSLEEDETNDLCTHG
ncbi:BtrH N-terminal domain-containing protein [Puniceibacterium sediminis]|uniref:Butirosin biosynthesis protein H, N-terminal n=1 Tax=Puniceibacterium sediminis TaxID=1608407 RepID=A0A238YTH3_9RHOB|nr:BtrH N-terminal domain-containing protein [Puniceibacterium sediminis]SNR74445.1 Butirosin biosynthesis protein H, N-terminal [Puniceibacterium sediminis]